MSKSKKKQKARERGPNDPIESVVPQLEPGAVEELPLDDDGETLELPASTPQAMNEGLFHDALEAATRAGVMREEGERLTYLYNGDTLSLKYMEPSDTEGASVMIAAFRLGVVFQVRNGIQVVYKPGAWEADIKRLASSETIEEPTEED